MRLFLLTLLFVVLQGCTVAYFKTEDNLNVSSKHINREPCVINYSIAIRAQRRQLTTGITEMSNWANEAKAKYIVNANKVFAEKGCVANYEEDKEKANFHIKVKISPYHSALGQEWLTGLSFGLIPSWGTRQGEYTYTFINRPESIQHTYSIDNVSYNHLVLFPVFWITFLTLDEPRAFERALENFLGNV